MRARAKEDEMEEKVYCNECRYWDEIDGCHRYGPWPVVHKYDPERGEDPMGAYVVEVIWPQTSPGDYCGDGKKK